MIEYSAPDRLLVHQAAALLQSIKPLLAGHGPELQGAVVADLAAIWVASHRCSDPQEQRLIHDELIALHTEHVRELVAMYVQERT